jgi:sugar O-acyltransferase (sialic acid O-acetyltransferase NeuD family)
LNQLPCVLIGAGDHARVLLDCLGRLGMTVLGCVDADSTLDGTTVGGAKVLGQDSVIADYAVGSIALVNAIGSTRSVERRRSVYAAFKGRGHAFLTVVHPSATVGASVELGEGVQVMAGAVLQAGTRIGANSIVNTGSIVDHSCVVGAHVHLAPGCVLSGGITIGEQTHIGTAAAVIQGVKIGSHCLVAAGAVVIDDVPDGACVMGVPARQRRS